MRRIVGANEPITYTVTLANGTMLTGTVTVTEPWSVYDASVWAVR